VLLREGVVGRRVLAKALVYQWAVVGCCLLVAAQVADARLLLVLAAAAIQAASRWLSK